MSKPSVTSLHDRLQRAEIGLTLLRQQMEESHYRQKATAQTLIEALRILWKVARLIGQERHSQAIAAVANEFKSELDKVRT
jgi:hypothetical protein